MLLLSLEIKDHEFDYNSIRHAIASGYSYNAIRDIVGGLPMKFEQLQRRIEKNGTLNQGRIHLVICPENPSHGCISVRAHCPYCTQRLVRLFKCDDCDKIINEINNQQISDEEKRQTLRALICHHSERTPIQGFPVNLLGVHLCNLYKYGLLDHIQHKSAEDQLIFIKKSIHNKSFNPFLSVNRLYSYIEMEMYSHAREVAWFWDNLSISNLEEQFLQTEAKAVCEDSAISELLSLSCIN